MFSRLTFVGAGHDLVLCVRMFEDALRTEELVVTLAIELDFFVAMDLTHSVVVRLVA
jgi:hypothetical protein